LALPATHLPAIEAALNATAAVLLTCGFAMIRRKRILAHKCFMLSGFGVSVAFLAVYLWFHAHYGDLHFTAQGFIRRVYFLLLTTHIALAGAIVPLVLITLSYALRSKFGSHRRIARWTLPLWLYVCITGVAVYWMLYQLYPPH
jgi:putative membrane protein